MLNFLLPIGDFVYQLLSSVRNIKNFWLFLLNYLKNDAKINTKQFRAWW
jgi:hypothetical protein